MATRISLEEQKAEGIKVLNEIDRVCHTLSLTYYLAYGTLLGAIRHKGFIPWDDDIDIWMPRKDYEVFIKEFNSHSKSDFNLKSWHTDKSYPFIVAKVVSTRTYVEEKCFKPIEGMGIWVDIFPLDTVTDKNRSVIKEELILEHKRWMSLFKQSTVGAKIKLFFYNLIQRDTKLSDTKQLPSYFMNKIYSLSSNADYSDTLVTPGGEREFSQYFKTADFSKTIETVFEGNKYPIPAGYDNILNIMYGDYMQLPPVIKQKLAKHLKKAVWVAR